MDRENTDPIIVAVRTARERLRALRETMRTPNGGMGSTAQELDRLAAQVRLSRLRLRVLSARIKEERALVKTRNRLVR
jgi:hypothetical protein